MPNSRLFRMNRRQFFAGTVAGVATAFAISPPVHPAIPRYTARDYFREFHDIRPGPGATYRNGQLAEFTGWLPEIIKARGVPNPGGEFFADWLTLLKLEGLVTCTPQTQKQPAPA